MMPIAVAMACLSLLLSSVSILGCSSGSDPTGRYFYFVGDRPQSDTFDVLDGPVMTLTFGDADRWDISVIMAEDMPLGGTWSREGDILTLVDKKLGVVATFKIERDALEYSDGIFPMKGKRFWKMSAKWETSLHEVGQRDATMAIAGNIAKGAIIYAGDNDETLPATQAEFEKALEPYVANKAMFIGFKYTFKGGKLPAESKRGSVELGVLQGPTGKAIVFLNAERKWVPAKYGSGLLAVACAARHFKVLPTSLRASSARPQWSMVSIWVFSLRGHYRATVPSVALTCAVMRIDGSPGVAMFQRAINSSTFGAPLIPTVTSLLPSTANRSLGENPLDDDSSFISRAVLSLSLIRRN